MERQAALTVREVRASEKEAPRTPDGRFHGRTWDHSSSGGDKNGIGGDLCNISKTDPKEV